MVATSPPLKCFFLFLLDDKTSSPDVFKSFSLSLTRILREVLVMVSYYGYDLRDMTSQVASGQSIFSKNV